MDNTLKALLRYVKQEDFDTSWQAVRDNVFAPLYHNDMHFVDVLTVLCNTYERALAEPRFGIPPSRSSRFEILMAPIEWSIKLDTQYTVEQFYNAIIRKMLFDLRFTRADWCKDELDA